MAVAARSEYPTMADLPQLSFAGRVARAFAYVLLVVTCTVVAALGGYQVGVRSAPAQGVTATDGQASTQEAVRAAVAEQAAEDRQLRREALAKAMRWQRAKLEAEFATRLDAQRLADAENAARAYRRGKQAGKAATIREYVDRAKARAAAEKPAIAPTAVPPAPEDAAAATTG